jgi:aspartate aminotransferase
MPLDTAVFPQTRSALIARLETGSRRPVSLGSAPDGTVSLAMGEPFGGTPESIIDAAIDALRAGRTRYERLTGSPSLREALAGHLSSAPNRAISPNEVVITHGASAGLAAAILAVVNPGDRVLLPEPTYSLYADHVAMAGGEVIWVPNHADGSLDLDLLGSMLPGARLIILCSPSNPTGRVLPNEDLQALGRILERHPTYLLCDEAYRDIIFDGTAFTSALQVDPVTDRVICCGTFSKSYAMTGWRLGWVVAPGELADRINLVHRTFNGALNTFVQDAALAALDLPSAQLGQMAGAFQYRRDIVLDALDELTFVTVARPQGAFYAFPHIHSPLSSTELTRQLADAGVLVRSGWEYGPSGEGHIRISYATDVASLREGMSRLTATLRSASR